MTTPAPSAEEQRLRTALAVIVAECVNLEQPSIQVRHRVRRIAQEALAAQRAEGQDG